MSVGTQDKAVRTATMWSPPEVGSVKFNVDGSAIGKPGPAGIGGILRNPNGSTLAVFSKSIGCEDSNVAEFLAIIEAFKVFRRSRWQHLNLVVESDSRNAVLWASNPAEIPWRLRNLSNVLCNLKMGVDNWCCRHVYRETNVEADALAKQGVNREVDLEFFLS